ncbi:MAG: hypothetical protein HYX97_04260 [Chloroflexi bacterium]|nr:hypothetical protein [Chloroflexota bacterium]
MRHAANRANAGLGSEPEPHSWRLSRSEISGGLADLSVLVPLEVALIAINGLNPTTTLLGVGIAYILAGLYFRIPMPVQPLKALAVIAVAQHLAPAVIAAGALLMSATLGFLATTGLINLFAVAIPAPLIRGVQMGLGFLLLKTGVLILWSRPFFIGGDRRLVEVAGVSLPLGLLIGLLGIALLLLALRWKRLPATVLVLAVGAAVGLSLGGWKSFEGAALGPLAINPAFPSAGDFSTALTLLVIPQIALTLTNSVFATVDAATVYFGPQAARVTPRRISLSIALGNLWAGLLGGLPICHGSGGLTAHYKLGARTPAATLFMGAVLITVALLFGKSALPIRTFIPYAMFGALLLYVGWQHLILGTNVANRVHLALAMLVAVVSVLPGSNLAWGLGAGLAVWWGLRAASAVVPHPAARRLGSTLRAAQRLA